MGNNKGFLKILIVGAGPAGSSCAIQLLKAGHSVTILDRTKFPRHKPGETLHPGVEPLLKELGVLDEVLSFNFLRHHGIENIRDSYSKYQAYNKDEGWRGFQLFREDFDLIFLNKAIELGAAFQGGVNPTKVNHSAEGITSIETSTGEFKADYFIDATGKRAWLANNLKIEFEEYSPKRIAYYGYIRNSGFKPINPKLIWDDEGWTWISQVKENLTAWVRLNLKEHEKIGVDWIPEILADGEPTGSRKAVDVTWRKAQTYCKENCFLAGDAAFVLDPGSSHGVLKALMSGIMVAHLISKISQNDLVKIHESYNYWMEQQFVADITKLKELYRDFEVDLNIL